MKKVFALLLLFVTIGMAQPPRTTHTNVPTFRDHVDTYSAGSTSDTSTSNNGFNSVTLRFDAMFWKYFDWWHGDSLRGIGYVRGKSANGAILDFSTGNRISLNSASSLYIGTGSNTILSSSALTIGTSMTLNNTLLTLGGGTTLGTTLSLSSGSQLNATTLTFNSGDYIKGLGGKVGINKTASSYAFEVNGAAQVDSLTFTGTDGKIEKLDRVDFYNGAAIRRNSDQLNIQGAKLVISPQSTAGIEILPFGSLSGALVWDAGISLNTFYIQPNDSSDSWSFRFPKSAPTAANQTILSMGSGSTAKSYWGTPASSAAGSTTQFIYNSSGAEAGSSLLTQSGTQVRFGTTTNNWFESNTGNNTRWQWYDANGSADNFQFVSDNGVGGSFPGITNKAVFSANHYIAPTFNFKKAHGTFGSETTVSNDDALGTLAFWGYDGSTYRAGGYIQIVNDGGTISSSNMNAYFSLQLSRNASVSPTEVLHIASDGGMTIPNSSGTAPTGGSKGAGTINLAGGIYLNGTAFNNPDFIFEKAYTGKIEKFKNNKGAKDYSSLLSLDSVESFTKKTFELPQVADKKELFERADALLARLEEAYLYIFQLNHRIKVLEKTIKTKNVKH